MSSFPGGGAPPPRDNRPGKDASRSQQPPLNPPATPDERFRASLRPVFNDILRLAQLLTQPVLTEGHQRQRLAIIRRINLRLSLHFDYLNYYNERREEAGRGQESNNRSLAEYGNEIRRLVEIERHLMRLMRATLPR